MDRSLGKHLQEPVCEEAVGLKRWLRLTARKTASSRKAAATSGNPVADAAADALASLFKDAKQAKKLP